MHLRALALSVVVLLAAAGCRSAGLGVLRVSGVPDDALVTVDDQYVGKLGRVRRFGIKVSEGEHRLTVEADGRFPSDQMVRVPSNGTVTVEVKLEPLPE